MVNRGNGWFWFGALAFIFIITMYMSAINSTDSDISYLKLEQDYVNLKAENNSLEIVLTDFKNEVVKLNMELDSLEILVQESDSIIEVLKNGYQANFDSVIFYSDDRLREFFAIRYGSDTGSNNYTKSSQRAHGTGLLKKSSARRSEKDRVTKIEAYKIR